MKLELRDRGAMRALSPVDVRAYLAAQGWRDVGRLQNKATVHTHTDQDGREWEILVPVQEDVADFRERMAETVAALARVEARPQIEIYTDLISAGSDVIRVHAPEADEQGTISLGDGVALHDELQNLLLSAACASVRDETTMLER
jgi:hypothetical protein